MNFLLQIYTKFRRLNLCLPWYLSHFLSTEYPLNRATAIVRSRFDRSNHDRMHEIGPGFSLFHYESLFLSIDLCQWVPYIPAVNIAQQGLTTKQRKSWLYFLPSSIELRWNHGFETRIRRNVIRSSIESKILSHLL